MMSVNLIAESTGPRVNHSSAVQNRSNYRPVANCTELTGPEFLRPAADLLISEYAKMGYLSPTDPQIHAKMLASLAKYRTFGLWEDGVLSAVAGLHYGPKLPMDALFGPELARLRSSGFKIGEIGKLAGTHASRAGILKLMAMVVQVAAHAVDCLSITVNPKHETFYVKVAGFRYLSTEVRMHPDVQKAPAVGLYAFPPDILVQRRARKTLGH